MTAASRINLAQVLDFLTSYPRRSGKVSAANAARIRAAITSLEKMLATPATTPATPQTTEERRRRLNELEAMTYATPRFRR